MGTPIPTAAAETTSTLRHLPALSKLDKNQFIQSYIRGQKLHAKAHAAEGEEIRASWDLDKSKSVPAGSCVSSVLPTTNFGFGTPVPKARVATSKKGNLLGDKIGALDMNVPKSASPVRNVACRTKEKPPSDDPPPRKPSKSAPRVSKVKPDPPATKNSKKRALDTDSDSEVAARLAERRERKRAKREIVKPIEEEAVSDDGSVIQDKKKGKGRKEKKAKIPAGFALMHGFLATNVGKNRLTIKPPPTVGVFNKGKASAKTRISEKKSSTKKAPPTNRFSELKFLNKSSSKPSKSTPTRVSSSSSIAISESASASLLSSVVAKPPPKSIITNRDRSKTRKSKKKLVEAAEKSDPSPAGHTGDSTLSGDKDVTPRQSVVWDIESEPDVEPASVVDTNCQPGTVILDTRVLKWAADHSTPLQVEGASSPARGHALVNGGESPSLGTRNDIPKQVSSSPSLGPSQSASQQGQRLPNVSTGMNSKYFFKPQSQLDNAVAAIPADSPVDSFDHTVEPVEAFREYTGQLPESSSEENMEWDEEVHRSGQSPGMVLDFQSEVDQPFVPDPSMSVDHDWGYYHGIEEPLPSSYDDVVVNNGGLDHIDYEGSLVQAQGTLSQDALAWTVEDNTCAEELYYGRFEPTSYEDNLVAQGDFWYGDPELADIGMSCDYENAETEYASNYGDGSDYGALDYGEQESGHEADAQYEWESNGYADDQDVYEGGFIGGDFSMIDLDAQEVQGYDFYDDEDTLRFHPMSQGLEKEEAMWEESIESDDRSLAPMQRFSQGRALLLGLSGEDEGRYPVLRNLKGPRYDEVSQAEADVVKHMSGHWLPQKL